MEKVTITGRIEEIERRPCSLYGNPKFRITLGHVSDCFIFGEQKHITNQVVVETEANSGEAYKIHTGMEGSIATFHCHITPKRRTNIIDSFTLNKEPESNALEAYEDVFGTSAQALRLRSKRMALIASDIANADSSFADKALDFKAIMAKELAPSVRYEQTMKHLTDRCERIRNSLRGDK